MRRIEAVEKIKKLKIDIRNLETTIERLDYLLKDYSGKNIEEKVQGLIDKDRMGDF